MAGGVDRRTAESAMADMDDDDARAGELARTRVGRLAGLPPEVALRRLADFLIRRGHLPEVARRAASSALGSDSATWD
jgi:SOS response regulatory protein OraA/RecX